jgi:hypothetical protein
MSTKKSSTPQLKEVVNVPEKVEAFGRKYAISRFALGQVCQAFDFAPYIALVIQEATSFSRDDKGNVAPTQAELMAFCGKAVAVCGPAVMGLISIATKEPLEWLEVQDDVVGGIGLFAKVVEKNLDFFTQENLARLKGMFGGLASKLNPTGGDSSTTLSSEATAP